MGLGNWNMLRIRTERKTKKKFGDPFDLAIDIDDYTIAAYIEENIWKKYGDIMKKTIYSFRKGWKCERRGGII